MSAGQSPQVELLLKKSAEDETVLTFAVPDAIFEFHVQQAIEKLLKAMLTAHGVQYPYTHDLQALVDELTNIGETFPVFVVPLHAFSKYGVAVRYDDVLPLAPEEREQYRQVVADLRSFAAARVSALP